MEKRGNIKLNCTVTGYLNASKKEIMVKLSVLEPRFPFMFVFFGNARNQTQSLGHDSKGPTDKLYSAPDTKLQTPTIFMKTIGTTIPKTFKAKTKKF